MIDFKRVPSPCFLLDERLLARNLSVVDRVRRESGAEVIVALKACAMWSIFRRYCHLEYLRNDRNSLAYCPEKN